uniref:Uncharacterized protein n=1 Tax=viral metagenome TaxID=1070528 RepID=A0A6C0DRD9_9ZZZZ
MAAAALEVDLSNLPPSIAKARGNMRRVFNIIYTDFATDAENNNNSNNYVIRDAPKRQTVLVMLDGRKLKFNVSKQNLFASPDGEIELSFGQSPDSLYLEHIGRSDKLKGVEATNYAYEIAATLGAKWLHIWDAAAIMCNSESEDEPVHAYPLSLYRALTSPTPTHPSWYENVAVKHGFTPNNTVSELYNYAESVDRLRSIRIAELLDYYTTFKEHIDSDEATEYINIENIRNTGSISGSKRAFSDDEDVKPNLLKHLTKIIEILSTTKAETLADFLKAPSSACLDKGYILRSFPGNGNMDFEIPNLLFDEDGELLSEFPYLVESLIAHKAGNHPSIKLSGGMRTIRSQRRVRYRTRRRRTQVFPNQ